jgi:hypothetical protein
MSSPSFLLANDSNHDLLRALLEVMNSIIEHKYKSKQSTHCFSETTNWSCNYSQAQSLSKLSASILGIC